MRKPVVLYISYDGMLEPLGQSQVIAYLEKLTDAYRFELISFEKPADWADAAKRESVRDRLRAAGIGWHPLTYHKAPTVPATLFDVAHGTLTALWLVLRHHVSMVHARSYLPALMGRVAQLLLGTRLLFDMRGLWADERVDGNLWSAGGRVYRTAKALERHLLLKADHVVTLTEASATDIRGFAYLSDQRLALDVITTCVDLDRFRPQPGDTPPAFTLGYVGSVGTWYLFDEVIEAYRLVRERRPDARLLIVNRNDQDFIRGRLAAANIPPERYEVVAADHRDVPEMIARMTVGTALIKPAYSKLSSAPTKLGEYLAMGVPCLANPGVGDVADILARERVGTAVAAFDAPSRAAAIDDLFTLLEDPALEVRCRDTARRLFSLDGGVAQYRAIYQTILKETGYER